MIINSTNYKEGEADRVKDIVLLLQKVDQDKVNDFKSLALIYDKGEFDSPSLINKSKVLNYPSSSTDSIYEIVPGTNQIWLLFKSVSTSTETEKGATTFNLLNCRLPKVIKADPRTIGLECQSSLEVLKLNTEDIPEKTKFLLNIMPGSKLNPLSNSQNELVITSKLGIWAGDLKFDDTTKAYKFNTIISYTGDSRLSVISEPLNSFIVEDKIYFSASAVIKDEKDEPKIVTKIFVYYSSNQAMSDAIEPFNGDGTLFVRESFYAGEYHDLFFIGNKLNSYASVKTHPFSVQFLLNVESQEQEKEVSVKFTIPVEKEEDKTRFLNFAITNNLVGKLESNLNGRAVKVYT